MIAHTKKTDRSELHRILWHLANDLRGSIDGWDFKEYVFVLLFYRYLSEKLTTAINQHYSTPQQIDFDYAHLPDALAKKMDKAVVAHLGFFILPSELFVRIQANTKTSTNLPETLKRIFRHIEFSAKGATAANFKGLFDSFDFNSQKLGHTAFDQNHRLCLLVNAIAKITLEPASDHPIDVFGDAYEFLMGLYASKAGKSGGEYYTPQGVSELLTRLTIIGQQNIHKVYDPACGSGSLLLTFAQFLAKDQGFQGFYGQERNNTTYNLCRMNMFVHNIDDDHFHIACGDTLTTPLHQKDAPFDAIVSNPPYSIKWVGNTDPDLLKDPRFAPAGVLAPKSKADFAFILHSLAALSDTGTAAIVCFPGILYRGGAEKKIRQYLVEKNFIDGIIQLPDRLFYGTSIATCIIILKKNKAINETLFIDASHAYDKVGSMHQLTAHHIETILAHYTAHQDIPNIARLIPPKTIQREDYRLSVSTYVNATVQNPVIDIKSVNAKLDRLVAQEATLRQAIAKHIENFDEDHL